MVTAGAAYVFAGAGAVAGAFYPGPQRRDPASVSHLRALWLHFSIEICTLEMGTTSMGLMGAPPPVRA